MERMAEAVPDSDDQILQNFLTHSSWDYRSVMNRVARKADASMGDAGATGLYLDESAFQKKGDKSVGVARQWNGRLGKQDNCQVGVFGALGRGDRVSLIDARLYLPREWTDDSSRCEEADVPRAQRIHRTKLELALQIVHHARQIGVRFDWVGMDGLYGQSLELLQTLEDQGEIFVADIHSDRHILSVRPDSSDTCPDTRPWPTTPAISQRRKAARST